MGAVACTAVALFAGIGAAFWFEDLRYSRPTPRPATLNEPALGTALALEPSLAAAGVEASSRPVLVHFLNPDCPCSRFNVAHVRELHRRFGDRMVFVAAVQTFEDGAPTAEARADLARRMADLDLGIPWFVDVGGRLAGAAGVYSTPQAVLTDRARRIAFRGNYNVSRYCTDPHTEFARIAIEKLLVAEDALALPALGSAQKPAYGCELPSNVQASK